MRVVLLFFIMVLVLMTGCVKLPVAPPPSSPVDVIITGLESPGQRDQPCYKTSN